MRAVVSKLEENAAQKARKIEFCESVADEIPIIELQQLQVEACAGASSQLVRL
jgi:hypothetical protein